MTCSARCTYYDAYLRIDLLSVRCYDVIMTLRRITANLPERLLEEAQAITGDNLTETLVHGLELVRRSAAYQKAQRLRGRLRLRINLEKSRERNRR